MKRAVPANALLTLLCLCFYSEATDICPPVTNQLDVSTTNTYLRGVSITFPNTINIVTSTFILPSQSLIMIVQMQGSGAVVDNNANTVNYGNIGKFEFHTVQSFTPTTITTVSSITTSFTSGSGSFFQIVVVPYAKTITLTSSITCLPFDTSTGTGGVFALVASETLNMNFNLVDCSAKGYSGAVAESGGCDVVTTPLPEFCPNSGGTVKGGNKGRGFFPYEDSIGSCFGAYANAGGGGNCIGFFSFGGGGGLAGSFSSISLKSTDLLTIMYHLRYWWRRRGGRRWRRGLNIPSSEVAPHGL